jgi:hypothetical protein
LTFPVTSDNGNEHIYLVIHAAALSNPMTIECPGDQFFACDAPVAIANPAVTGACGAVTYEYTPPLASLALGTTTPVTVKATDTTSGATAECTFNVTRQYTALSIPTCPGDLVFTCADTFQEPTILTSGGCGTVTVSFAPPFATLPPGTTSVTATATDSLGHTAQCTFNVTRSTTVDFAGFQEPIGGFGGTCTVPFTTISRSSSTPFKFTLSCGGVPITTGELPVHVEECGGSYVADGVAQFVANVFHFNLNTQVLQKNHKYTITVTLPDGTTRSVVIKLK